MLLHPLSGFGVLGCADFFLNSVNALADEFTVPCGCSAVYDVVRVAELLPISGTSCAADVGNAFLYGKTKEKVYIVAGQEFGSTMAGRILIIVKSL